MRKSKFILVPLWPGKEFGAEELRIDPGPDLSPGKKKSGIEEIKTDSVLIWAQEKNLELRDSELILVLLQTQEENLVLRNLKLILVLIWFQEKKSGIEELKCDLVLLQAQKKTQNNLELRKSELILVLVWAQKKKKKIKKWNWRTQSWFWSCSKPGGKKKNKKNLELNLKVILILLWAREKKSGIEETKIDPGPAAGETEARLEGSAGGSQEKEFSQSQQGRTRKSS